MAALLHTGLDADRKAVSDHIRLPTINKRGQYYMNRFLAVAATLLISPPAQSGEMRQMEGDILLVLQDEAEAARVEQPALGDMGIIDLAAALAPEMVKDKVYKGVADKINDTLRRKGVDKYAVASVRSSCPTTPWLFWRPEAKGHRLPQPEGYFQFQTPEIPCVEIHVVDAKAIAKTFKSDVLVEFASGLNISIEGYVNADIIYNTAETMSDRGLAFYTMFSGSHVGAQPEIQLITNTMQKIEKAHARKQR